MADITRTGMRIQARGDSQDQWIQQEPVLLKREIGYETNTGRFKIGDGTSTWSMLPYAMNDDFRFAGEINVKPEDDEVFVELYNNEQLSQGDVFLITGDHHEVTVKGGYDGGEQITVRPDALIGYFNNRWKLLSEGLDGRITLKDYNITDAYTKIEVDKIIAEKMSGMFTYKGSSTVENLPKVNKIGDVYNITIEGASNKDEDPKPNATINEGTEFKDIVYHGDNVAWVQTETEEGHWDKFGNIMDLNGFKWFRRVKIPSNEIYVHDNYMVLGNGNDTVSTLLKEKGLYYLLREEDGCEDVLIVHDTKNATFIHEGNVYNVSDHKGTLISGIVNAVRPFTLQDFNADVITEDYLPVNNSIIKTNFEIDYAGEESTGYFLADKSSKNTIFLTKQGIGYYDYSHNRMTYPSPITIYKSDNTASTGSEIGDELDSFIFSNKCKINELYKYVYCSTEDDRWNFMYFIKGLKCIYMFINQDMFSIINTALGDTVKELWGDVHLIVGEIESHKSLQDIGWHYINEPKEKEVGLTKLDVLHTQYPGHIVCGSSSYSSSDVGQTIDAVGVDTTIVAKKPIVALIKEDITIASNGIVDIFAHYPNANKDAVDGPKILINNTDSETQFFDILKLENANIGIATTNSERRVSASGEITFINSNITSNLDMSASGTAKIVIKDCKAPTKIIIKLPTYTTVVPRIDCKNAIIQTAEGKQYFTYEAHGSDTKGVIIAVDILGDMNFLPYDLEG